MRRFGIMGGTFDPIHFGHLLIAERAREQFDLEKIVFVPAGIPAHKKSYQVSDVEHRWQMTCVAIASNVYFEPSRIEIDRPGVSYAIDTVNQFRMLYPGIMPYFITGMDAVLEILTWHRAAELPGLCEFVAAARPGVDFEEYKTVVPEHFRKSIHVMTVPLMEISSTAIRQRRAAGKSIRYMTTDDVCRYIEEKDLYIGRNA